MIRRLNQLLLAIMQSLKIPFFGFIQGHAHLSPNDWHRLEKLVGVRSDQVVSEYEKRFAKLLGNGIAVSYATGRMAFFDLMRLLGIGDGDEVILLGATCSVMVNAVLRIGATPVFADIDPSTLGSSSQAIEACITNNTRLIVAQHSFGIPCDIVPIVKLAKEKNIFLLEDCALTLGSKVNEVIVGNFGDAALFSTDHSKPLNTLTGGLIYTRDTELANRLRISQISCSELSHERQKALWRRLILEARLCVPNRYGSMALIDLVLAFLKKLSNSEGDLLADDFGSSPSRSYSYPAKFPAFLAALGLIEVERWPMVAVERQLLLAHFFDVVNGSPIADHLPDAYKNNQEQIVPLRFVWSDPDAYEIRQSLCHFINVSWTFFMQPIIGSIEPLAAFRYKEGCCPVSEGICPLMVNIPCNIPYQETPRLLTLIERYITAKRTLKLTK
jgi:dTDP-4-amino-4,6-dideoxygalactose transaminase